MKSIHINDLPKGLANQMKKRGIKEFKEGLLKRGIILDTSKRKPGRKPKNKKSK